ncbi:MAG: glycosyltransferase [Candidatus Latescibacteria bacterium]|nr:glycosyltransferase [Candidatus Latescibacterota bacterium]
MNQFFLIQINAFRLMLFILVQVVIAISNAILMKRIEKFTKVPAKPNVSVLIPARNEEKSIRECVNSLINQNYQNLEVIVLDDNSTDKTLQILQGIKSNRLRIIQGKPLPDGWVGKSWACQQLSESASGDLLFFTDADTIFDKKTLTHAISAMQSSQADLISAIHKNEVKTLGEKITIPFIVWSIFTILPLAAAYILKRSKALCAANGKFMLLRKEVYRKIGGHAAVKDNAIEDVALAKLVKAKGGKWRMFDASNLSSARMYHSFTEAMQGFTKNFFALFGYKILIALFVWTWIGIITYLPLARTGLGLINNNFDAEFLYSVISVTATCFLWVLMSVKFKFPLHQFLFYPITITVSIFIGLRSMIMTIANRTVWKGRRLKSAKVRWL